MPLKILCNYLFVLQHIDGIMSVYGNQIMQAVVFILEGDHSPQVKEQVLLSLCSFQVNKLNFLVSRFSVSLQFM